MMGGVLERLLGEIAITWYLRHGGKVQEGKKGGRHREKQE